MRQRDGEKKRRAVNSPDTEDIDQANEDTDNCSVYGLMVRL
jgi:hypothetical protein